MEAIAAAVARGLLAPAEAAELAKVVDTFAKAIEMRDFDARLRELEAQYSAASSPDPTAVIACYSPRSLNDG
jgi:hypothetical protein